MEILKPLLQVVKNLKLSCFLWFFSLSTLLAALIILQSLALPTEQKNFILSILFGLNIFMLLALLLTQTKQIRKPYGKSFAYSNAYPLTYSSHTDLLQEHTHYGLMLLDERGSLLAANPMACRLFSIQLADVLHYPVGMFYPWKEQREELLKILQQALNKQCTEERLVIPEANICLRMHFVILPNMAESNLAHLLWEFEAIPLEVDAEYQEAKYWENLCKHSQALLYIKDEHGRYMAANQSFAGLFETEIKEVIGKKDRDLFAGHIAQSLWLNDREVLTTGQNICFEERILAGDSHLTFLSVKSALYDEKHEPYALCGISIDISRQKQELQELQSKLADQNQTLLEKNKELVAELTLRRYTEKLLAGEKDVLEMIRSHQPLADILQRLCLAIESLCRDGVALLLILKPEGGFEYSSLSFDEKFAAEQKNYLLGQVQACYQSGAREHKAVFLRTLENLGITQPKTGETLSHGYVMPVCLSANQPAAIIAVYYSQHHKFEDIEQDSLVRLSGLTGIVLEHTLSEQARQAAEEARSQAIAELKAERNSLAHYVHQRTQELRTANAKLARAIKARDDFLANMSHELRTPLNSVLTIVEVMKEGVYGELSEKQSERLQAVYASGQHLLSLINDVLDLAKIEAGQMHLNLNHSYIKHVLKACVGMVQPAAQKKHQKLSSQCADDLESVYIDELRVKQILVNLLGNAIKFTPDGGKITVEVDIDEEKNSLHFRVTDTGIGIEADKVSHLFKPFVQLQSGISRNFEGTGLGLSLVYRLVELHGGSIHVESEMGKGSCFHVYLPRDKESHTQDGSAEEQEISLLIDHQQVTEAAQHHILVADDNAFNIGPLETALKIAGYEVSLAYSGTDVLEQVKRKRPDLILMDIQMPNMDGLEATRQLRKHTEYQDILIFAVTALAMPGDREACLDAGMQRYFSKPVTLRALIQTIREDLAARGESL